MSAEHATTYWRSLEELANTPEFQRSIEREFPALASEWADPVSRRSFLKLMSASLALAGLTTACTRQPIEKILPYVKQPEEITPGLPLFFASAMPLGGYGLGVLVRSSEGRPTKIEGNPEHPISLGATNVFMQASVLDLYDPDRAQAVLRGGAISSWDAFLGALNEGLQAQEPKRGSGLRFLTGTVTSPTLAWQLNRLLQRFPGAKWHQYEPINHDSELAAMEQLFGKKVQPQYHLDQPEVIVSLESDFLFRHPASLRYARQFTNARRLSRREQQTMNRLYVAESSPTITGSMADERLPIASSRIERIAAALMTELGFGAPVPQGIKLDDAALRWIKAAAADLRSHAGRSLVIAGEEQTAAVHTLAHYLNHRLENVGQAVTYTERVEARPVRQLDSIRELTSDMEKGSVDLLIVLGTNPVFTVPASSQFAPAMRRVKTVVQLSSCFDETSRHAHWHIPEAHYLESWSDVRAWDGTTSIMQPLIEPLFGGRSPHELLDAITQLPPRNDYEIVREYWRSRNLWDDFEKGWRKAVHDGLVSGSALQPVKVSVRDGLAPSVPSPGANERLEISFRPDPSVWDGRFANNGWLQETPRPFTKLTWDNALLISPALAAKESFQSGDVVSLQLPTGTFTAPVWIMPGQADETVTVHLGYGRSQSGRIGTGVGFDAYAARGIEFTSAILHIQKEGHTHRFATTQGHHSVAGRNIIHAATFKDYQHNPNAAHEAGEPAPAPDETLYPEMPPREYAWGMVIDLNTCIGCNACTVACQAENNIPVVGKDQVLKHREMNWIRIDTYFRGAASNPEMTHQPLPCMHCEKAPCELVCPVEATLHDSEGLNLQVYNRCVGTRYCSNNCPYKVRRFNFLQYADQSTPSLQLRHNPDVTVRTRGVMEKCTYCVQRIRSAHIAAEKENRPIQDGEIKTACQQACPAEAIVFGNIGDRQTAVAQLRTHPLNYALLAELNTRPRTTYLARVRNPSDTTPSQEKQIAG